MNQVLCGTCEDVLKGIPANSVDSIVMRSEIRRHYEQ